MIISGQCSPPIKEGCNLRRVCYIDNNNNRIWIHQYAAPGELIIEGLNVNIKYTIYEYTEGRDVILIYSGFPSNNGIISV